MISSFNWLKGKINAHILVVDQFKLRFPVGIRINGVKWIEDRVYRVTDFRNCVAPSSDDSISIARVESYS
ncbi:hypothetical protein NC652_036135 [Populus alba x Populus x berolinensis]|nr:hypothetical protein NC652_036135 [Populus alba x Populus x berolinensis]